MHRVSALLSAAGFLLAACPFVARPIAAQSSAQPAAKASTRPGAAPVKPKSLLPEAFAGWVAESPAASATAEQIDATNVEVLKEYGFTAGETSTYKRSGETLTVKALRFNDASGAFGAYSFYRQNNWPKEAIGSGATSDHNRVLFWVGFTLIDASYAHIGPMSGSEMRDLAAQLPAAAGPKSLAPPILAELPKASLEGQSTHYAVGPKGYVGAGGVLPPEIVSFDRGAEAVTGTYSLSSNPAVLTLIDYPTPQLAAAQESRIRAYLKAGSQAQPAWPKPLQDSDTASLEVRRSGPLVAVVSGDAIPEESHKLIESVHYDADITTMDQPAGKETEIQKTAKVLMGIAGIVIVGVFAALLLGFFLGGGRALWRVAHGKPASTVYEAEFIRIDLHQD